MIKIDINQKKILILIFALIFSTGQFIFIFLVQSKVIWEFSGVFSGSSPWGGELTTNVPSNPLSSNKYVIEASGSFTFVGSGESGSVTFTHVDSNQVFYFSYNLGEGPFIGTEYERKTWTLPPGEYNIIWYNSDAHPHYKLIAVSFFYPYDEIVIPISGFLALFCAIGVISLIIRIRKMSW